MNPNTSRGMSDDFLIQMKSPPSDGWSPGGRRLLECRIDRVSLSHCARGCVEEGIAKINSGTFYEMRGGEKLPITVTVYPAANYKDMVIDQKETGFGHFDIQSA